jgi:hypothetical protein
VKVANEADRNVARMAETSTPRGGCDCPVRHQASAHARDRASVSFTVRIGLMSSANRDRRVLAAQSWVGFNYASGRERYEEFRQRAAPAHKMFIESIILHGHITVPTEDFMTLTALADVLGPSAIIELLDADVLDFVRVRGALAYVGGGGGILQISFPYTGNEPSAIGAELADAVDWALSPLIMKPDAALRKLVIARTKEIDLLSLSKTIAERAYEDFMRLPYAKGLDPKNLPGPTSRTVQVLGGQAFHYTGHPVTGLLAIATANLELELMAQTGSSDAGTSTPIGHALRAREISVGVYGDKFATLKELSKIPDIGEAVLNGSATISQLTKLHRSTAGAAFREWFHEHCAADPLETAKAYVDLLKEACGSAHASKDSALPRHKCDRFHTSPWSNHWCCRGRDRLICCGEGRRKAGSEVLHRKITADRGALKCRNCSVPHSSV